MTDRSADPDELLAKGWHLSCFAIRRPGESGREYRLVLTYPEQARKLLGFGKDFAEALANAAGQV